MDTEVISLTWYAPITWTFNTLTLQLVRPVKITSQIDFNNIHAKALGKPLVSSQKLWSTCLTSYNLFRDNWSEEQKDYKAIPQYQGITGETKWLKETFAILSSLQLLPDKSPSSGIRCWLFISMKSVAIGGAK